MVGMAKVCSNDVERQHGGVEESGFAVSPGLNFRQGIKYSRPLCKRELWMSLTLYHF